MAGASEESTSKEASDKLVLSTGQIETPVSSKIIKYFLDKI